MTCRINMVTLGKVGAYIEQAAEWDGKWKWRRFLARASQRARQYRWRHDDVGGSVAAIVRNFVFCFLISRPEVAYIISACIGGSLYRELVRTAQLPIFNSALLISSYQSRISENILSWWAVKLRHAHSGTRYSPGREAVHGSKLRYFKYLFFYREFKMRS
jgi:hypothetical protein